MGGIDTEQPLNISDFFKASEPTKEEQEKAAYQHKCNVRATCVEFITNTIRIETTHEGPPIHLAERIIKEAEILCKYIMDEK